MKKQSEKRPVIKGCLERLLRQFSCSLQQKAGNLSRRRGLLLLAAFTAVSSTIYLAVMLRSLRHPEEGHWKVTPIRAFPLPAAGNASQPPGSDTTNLPLRARRPMDSNLRSPQSRNFSK